MDSVLVTGAAGFIASHLIEELLQSSSEQIIGIDNMYSGTLENIEYLNGVDKNNKFTFIEGDIRDFDKLNEIIKKYEIKRIFHFAAIVSVQESIQNPLLSNEVNLGGTLKILEAARLNGVSKLVFSSSAAVYGDEPSQPKNEHSTTKPISPYGYEKLMGEQYMDLYSNLYGVDTVSLRYFNVYGERQSATSDYSGVISIFETKFKNNEIPNIYGDGEQYRDFVYVKDVVKVNIKAMFTEELKNDLLCVGTGQKTSINDLFEDLNSKYDKSYKANYLEVRDGDIRESLCDNTKIKSVLDIKEFTSFSEGILKL